ncbi:hypothetical protein [Frankia sp. CcWB2]
MMRVAWAALAARHGAYCRYVDVGAPSWQRTLGTAPAGDLEPVLLARGAAAWDAWLGMVPLLASVTEVHILGADILDGAYGAELTVRYA